MSKWRIRLPRENNAFDLNSLTDVVFRINYTARDGGEALRLAAKNARETKLKLVAGPGVAVMEPPLQRLFSARHEFPIEWRRFTHPAEGQPAEIRLPLSLERFPYFLRGRVILVTRLELYLFPIDSHTHEDIANEVLGLSLQHEVTVSGTDTKTNVGTVTLGFSIDSPMPQKGAALNLATVKIQSAVTHLTLQMTTDIGPFPISRMEDLVVLLTYVVL